MSLTSDQIIVIREIGLRDSNPSQAQAINAALSPADAIAKINAWIITGKSKIVSDVQVAQTQISGWQSKLATANSVLTSINAIQAANAAGG